MRMALLGPEGSGKDEYANKLADKYGVPVVAVSELLRSEVESGSQLGLDIQKGQKGKKPVHDDLVLQVMYQRLSEKDVEDGFILEGGPKTSAQAEGVDAFLLRQGRGFAGVVLIRYDYDEFMESMTGRLTCRECGSIFNIYTSPPVVEKMCDECGGRLHRRVDDREETISRRLREYESVEEPLTKFYQDRLEIVEGGFDDKSVFKSISRAAEKLKKAAPEIQVSSTQEEETVMADEEKKKKAAAKKKVAAKKKKAASKKKVAAKKKKAAPKKKVVAKKKKAAPKKKVAAKKKKAAPKKKVAAKKKKAAPKKKVAAKKKKAAPKKKVAAKKKKAAPKKKVAAKKKKAAPKKKVAAKKKKAAKKKAKR
ncbi:MAG: nucleoside monophosphate kinase [Gammaproteobacteria bacterium]|nr:nucleoside monophosphate kinase [Gammaproteobacteria bacterium]